MPFPKNAHKSSPVIKPSLRPDILALLTEHGPMTTKQIAERLGCTSDGAGYAMRHAPNDFYVSDWTKTGQQIWSAGKGTHVPRPAPSKKSQVTMAGRKKDRSDAKYLNNRYVTSERIWGI